MTDLEAIRQRAAAARALANDATPGPWRVYYGAGASGWPWAVYTDAPNYECDRQGEVPPGEYGFRAAVVCLHGGYDTLAHDQYGAVSYATSAEVSANYEFIAAARSELPALADDIDALAAEIERLRAEVEQVAQQARQEGDR